MNMDNAIFGILLFSFGGWYITSLIRMEVKSFGLQIGRMIGTMLGFACMGIGVFFIVVSAVGELLK